MGILFTKEKYGFTSSRAMMLDAISELTKAGGGGFKVVFPTPPAVIGPTTDTIVLETTSSVNPLHDGDPNAVPPVSAQPWRICIKFKVDADPLIDNPQAVRVFIGTPLQISDTGVVSYVTKFDPKLGTEDVLSGELHSGEGVEGSRDFMTGWFINRRSHGVVNTEDMAGAHPMSYRLVTSDRGIAFIAWDQAAETAGGRFAWFVAQRPVDHKTGDVIVAGRAPVFAVFSPYRIKEQEIFKFVVRESDVSKPTLPVSATQDTPDSNAIINDKQQVAISEDNRYIVTLPKGLNTPRYAYTYELDMLAYTSADVVSQYTEVPLEIYPNKPQRLFKAMIANGPNNTLMRLLLQIGDVS